MNSKKIEKNQKKSVETSTSTDILEKQKEESALTTETKLKLLPLGTEIETGQLKKSIEADTKSQVDIELDFSQLKLESLPKNKEEQASFENFQKETFILMHQLVALDDTVITPEILKNKSYFFGSDFLQHYTLSENAKVLYGKLKYLYESAPSGSSEQKELFSLMFGHWELMVEEIQKGVSFASKLSQNNEVLKKNQEFSQDISQKENEMNKNPSFFKGLFEHKGNLLTTAVVGGGALWFLSKFFGKSEKKSSGFFDFFTGNVGKFAMVALGLSLLSGKNPLESLTKMLGEYFLGGDVMKKLLETTIQGVIGEELTTLLAAKIEGKITYQEFSDAWKNGGVTGIGKLLIEKKIEFTEDEWTKLSEKLGLPSFSVASALWKEKDEIVSSNATEPLNENSAEKDGIKYEKLSDALANYKEDVRIAFKPIGKYLSDNKTAATIAGTWLLAENMSLITGIAASAGSLTLDSSLKLAKLPFRSKTSFSLASFFGVTSFLFYKNSEGVDIEIPKDFEELKKWLRLQLDDPNNKKWLQEHGVSIPDSELEVVAGILSGKKKLKDYLEKPKELLGATIDKAIDWAKLSPEQVLMRKNMQGLTSFSKMLDILQDEGENEVQKEAYKKAIEHLNRMQAQLTEGKGIIPLELATLKNLLTTANPALSIFSEEGYISWKIVGDDLLVKDYGHLCVDPNLSEKEATKKALRFVTKDSVENIPQIADMKLTEWRMMFREIGNEWKEAESMDSNLARLMLKGGQLAIVGTEAVFLYGGQRFILGPWNFFSHIFTGIFNKEKFSAVEMVHDYVDGLMPVLVFGTVSSLTKGQINPFTGSGFANPLIRSALYPITGGIEFSAFVGKHILPAFKQRDLGAILKNPRNRIRTDFFQRYNNISNTFGYLTQFMGDDAKSITSHRGTLISLYHALHELHKGQGVLISRSFNERAEKVLDSVEKVKKQVLNDMPDPNMSTGTIDLKNEKVVIERLEKAVLKEEEIIEKYKKIIELKKNIKRNPQLNTSGTLQQEIDTLTDEITELNNTPPQDYQGKMNPSVDTSSAPHAHSDLKTKVDAPGWTQIEYDALSLNGHKYSYLKGILDTLEDTEKSIQEQLRHAHTLTDPIKKKEQLKKIQEELITPFGKKKSLALQLVFNNYKNLPLQFQNPIKSKVIQYMKTGSVLGTILRAGKGRGIFMVAQAVGTLAVQEGLKQYENPERDMFDFYMKFQEENMGYEVLQVLVDILPFAGTYSNFHAALTGKQLVYQAASFLKGTEVKPSVEVSDVMSRVSNALWGSVGLAGDIGIIAAAIPTWGLSTGLLVPANIAARLTKLMEKGGKTGKIAQKLLDNFPLFISLSSKMEDGLRGGFTKMLSYASMNAVDIAKTAKKLERPLFLGALSTTVSTFALGYVAGRDMDVPEDIAAELDDASTLTTKPST